MERVAMTLAALLALPVASSDAALLPRVGAWVFADAPVQVEPATPEAVPVQQPVVEVVEPPATTDGPATDAAAPAGGPAAMEPAEAPTTVEPTPAEPTPVEPTPVEREPQPAPAWPVATPAAEEPWARPRNPPPPPGTGMRVGGGILIGLGGLDVLAGGLGLAAASSIESIDPATATVVRRISAVQLVFGLVEVGAGIGLVIPGVRRADDLTAWESEHGVDAPKTGNGMIVGGSVLLGVGAFDGLMAGVITSQTGDVPVLNVVVAIGEVAAGAALLGVGLTRKKRYREWERSNFATPSLSLLPGGVAMGLRGRF